MEFFNDNSILDAPVLACKSRAVLLALCSEMPLHYGEAITPGSFMLGSRPISAADFDGPESVAGGRVLTVHTQIRVSIALDGIVRYIALCSPDTLLHVTACPDMPVTAGDLVDVLGWPIAVRTVQG